MIRWPIVLLLALIGLIRPLVSIADDYATLGKPFGPLLVTTLIAVAWVGIVVWRRAPNPFLTLVAAGAAYGLGAIVVQQIIWRAILDAPPAEAPTTAPILVISWLAILVTNIVWGAVLGLIAVVLGQVRDGGAGRGARQLH